MAINPEQYLISSVLRDQDITTAIAAGVNGEMFHSYNDEWKFIENYFGKFRRVPTKPAFKTKFEDFVVKAVNDTGHFADEVRASHARFEMKTVLKEASLKMVDGDLDGAINYTNSAMVKIAAGMGSIHDTDVITDWQAIADDAQDRFDRVQAGGLSGIPTGFQTLDERTGGPNPGEFWVVAARLGQAKSWTVQKMATAAIMSGYTVQFDALEQSRTQVSMRVHSFLSSSVGKQIFNNQLIQQGKDYDPKLYKQFLRGLKNHVKGKLHVSDTSRGKVTPLTIASQIERNQPDIVFVDQLSLVGKVSADWQGYAEAVSQICQLTKSYQVATVAVNQLNREHGLGKEPAGPEALSGSDQVGQDADLVMTQKQVSPHAIVAKVPKYRNGEGGFKWYNEFNPAKGLYREVSYSKYQDIIDADRDQADADAEKVRNV